MAPCHRLISSEQICSEEEVQDGVVTHSDVLHRTGGLGRIDRPERCIFSCPNPPKVSQVSPLLCGGGDLRIHCPSVRLNDSSLDLHQNSGACCCPFATAEYSSERLSRRLVGEEPRQSHCCTRHKTGGSCFTPSWLSSQSRKVRVETQPGFCLSRDSFQDRSRPVTSSSRQNPEDSFRGHGGVDSKFDSCPPVSQPHWPSEFCHRPCALGSAACSSSAALPIVSVAFSKGSTVRHGSVVSSSPFCRLGVLDDTVSFVSRSSAPETCHIVDSVLRRVSSGVGSPPELLTAHQGCMVTSRVAVAHQCVGANGSFPCDSPFSSASAPPSFVDTIRQFDSGGLHQQAGRNEVSRPLSSSLGSSPALSQGGHLSGGSSHPGCSECRCRCFKQAVSSASTPGIRVAVEATDFPVSVGDLAQANDRSVCHEAQSSASSVYVTCPGQSGSGNGCSQPVLARSSGLCLSTVLSDRQSAGQDQGHGLSSPPDRSQLAESVLVRRSAQSSGGQSQNTSSVARSTLSSSGQSLPSRSGNAQTARLAPVWQQLQADGFSEQTAKHVARPQRASTSRLYDAKWQFFSNWCFEREIDPFKASVQNVANFLTYLFEDAKLEVVTICNYKSAIRSVLNPLHRWREDYVTVLRDLMTSFRVERPPRLKAAPQWDLNLVLRFLSKEFEPLEKATLDRLSQKTLFLVAMATSKRISELHAIDYNSIVFAQNKASFSFIKNFMAKNQKPGEPSPVISIPSLSGFVTDKADASLCPVRALKLYVERTTDPAIRKGRQRLFVPYRQSTIRELNKPALAAWLSRLIKAAYAYAEDHDDFRVANRFSPHEIRALSTSWAQLNSVPVEAILAAGCWRKSSTFTSFYLRDLRMERDRLFSFGPLVCAGGVIPPQH